MQKRYHRVPQFLLRRFSEDRGHIGYVPIEEKCPAQGKIKELAQSQDFYSPKGEKALGNIERSIGWILSEYDKKASFSMGDFNNLALYVITQDIRTNTLHSPQMERPQFWIEFLGRPDLADKPEQVIINELLKRCSDLKIMSQAFGPDLEQLNKVLLLNKTDIGFITSDVAVGFSDKLLYFELGWRLSENILLSRPGVLWFFPISKDRCLLFYNKHTYSMNDRNNELSIFCWQDVRDINRCLLETGMDKVMFFENIYYDLRCMDFSYEDHVLKGSNLLNEAAVDMPIERIISPAFSFLSVRRGMKDLQTRLYKETGNGNDLAINYVKMANRCPGLFCYPQPPQGGMYD